MMIHQKRIHSLDIFRGLGIAAIVIVHRIHYSWQGFNNPQILGEYMRSSFAPLIFITIAFFTMAGIFYVISGAANSISIFNRISSKKNTARQIVIGGISSGVVLLILNYIQRIFLMNGFIFGPYGQAPEYPIGLLVGYIHDPANVTFRFNQITEPGTLAVIGLILIAVSITLYFLIRKDGFTHINRIYTILAILGGIFLLSSPFIKFLLLPYYTEAYNSSRYFLAFILGFFCHEFSLFPYLGYGFFGAIFGISVAKKESFKLIVKRILILSVFLLVFGVLALVLGNRETALGERLMGSGISYLELMVFLLIGLLGLKYWDYAGETKIAKRQNRQKNLKRFGKLTLTVYLFEPLLAEVLKKIIDNIFGITWSYNLLLVIGFGFLCLLLWSIILWMSEGVDYIGSFEWFTRRTIYKFSKRDISSYPNYRNVFIVYPAITESFE